MDDLTLSDNPGAHRYELRKEDTVAAFAQYKLVDGAVVFTHTEVQPAYEGQGIGSRLAKFALDDVRRQGLKAVPVCKFIAAYIKRHTDYLDLVPEDGQGALRD